MPRTIEQAVTFKAGPARLYRICLSSREHAKACGGWGTSTIQARVGGRMTMAPHITGKFLLLVPGKLIVQTWRGSDWKRSEPDSVLVLTLTSRRGSGRLTMVHANVPDGHAASITRGWQTYYWRPWKRYFARR